VSDGAELVGLGRVRSSHGGTTVSRSTWMRRSKHLSSAWGHKKDSGAIVRRRRTANPLWGRKALAHILRYPVDAALLAGAFGALQSTYPQTRATVRALAHRAAGRAWFFPWRRTARIRPGRPPIVYRTIRGRMNQGTWPTLPLSLNPALTTGGGSGITGRWRADRHRSRGPAADHRGLPRMTPAGRLALAEGCPQRFASCFLRACVSSSDSGRRGN